MENDFIENLIAKRQQENKEKAVEPNKDEQPIAETVAPETIVDNSETSVETKEEATVSEPLGQEEKSLQDVSISNLKVKLDETQSFEEQAETIASAMTVASAVQDEGTRQTLIDAKSEELKIKAKTKVTEKQAEATNAVTKKQKSEREKFSTILETFGIYRHLPRVFLYPMLVILHIVYGLFVLAIGIPTGAIKYTVDCLDGIFIRYDEVEDKRKPKVKIFSWIFLGFVVLIIVCLTALAVSHII